MPCGKRSNVGRAQDTQQVLGPRACAAQQQEPSNLEVSDCGDPREQSKLLGKDSMEVLSNVLMVSKRRPKPAQTSVGRRTGSISNANMMNIRDASFARVQADTGLCKQVGQ